MNVRQGAEEAVLLSSADRVATVTLNRPASHNSLEPELLARLIAIFEQLNGQAETSVIVLRAAGDSFSTGGDLREFQARRSKIADYADELVGQLNRAIMTIAECRYPVIVAVDGQVTGGSLGLVLAADIVVVTKRASFTPYYVDVGFSPDGGWTAMLPEIIGLNRAAAAQLLNATITAQQALDWGMAHRLTDAERLQQDLDEISATLLTKKSGSVRATRKLLGRGRCRDYLDAEREAFVRQVNSKEALNGIDEFVSRQK